MTEIEKREIEYVLIVYSIFVSCSLYSNLQFLLKLPGIMDITSPEDELLLGPRRCKFLQNARDALLLSLMM